MNQKTRNKIAAALSVLLVPTMIYLLYTNINKARERRRKPTPSENKAAAVTADPTGVPDLTSVLQPIAQTTPSKQSSAEQAIDPEVLKEQRKIAALQPERNSFGLSMSGPRSQTPPAYIRQRGRGAAKPGRAQQRNMITVAGIIFHKARGMRMAVVNGQVLKEGERVDSWTIVKINRDNVILDNGAKKITIGVRK